MSFAVIKTGGKQYRVKAGEILKIEKLENLKASAKIEFKEVLAYGDDKTAEVGTPKIDGAKVEADLLENGNSIAEKVIEIYESRLARAIASVVNIFDPEVIVLGGGMSNISRLYETVPDLVRKWTFGKEFSTHIKQAVHGDSSGVRGAAWLW